MDENEYFGETRQEENIYPDESPRDEDILSLPDEPEVTDETVCAEETFAADKEIPLAAETFQDVTETPAEQTLTPAFPEPMFNIPPMLTRLEGLDRESFWEEVGKAKPQRKKPKKALVVLPEPEESVVRATANLAEAKVSYVNTLNVYDILNAGKVVLTKAAKESVEEVYA